MSLRARICANAALLGEEGLVALANRGLVRRARKDLENAQPEPPQESADGLVWRWDHQNVVLSERPADSRCTCPAGGICRHILACLIQAAGAAVPATDAAGAPIPAAPCGEEILALSDEDIERWAGKPLVRRARRELALGLTVVAQDGAPFVGRVGEWNVECRWLPGGGPAGMVCSCHELTVCLHRVTVVLAWQVERGQRTIEREDAVLEASIGAVRTRAEVCAEVTALGEDLVCLGFTRLGPGHAERCRTLALSAHGVDLPRLERSLQVLATDLDGWLARDPQASDERLLERLASCWALAKALRKPSSDLVGVHRSQYERVQRLDLVGAGLETWRTSSGYHGVSVYFWDHNAQSWCTWSEARPITTPGFDPLARIAAPGPWPGAANPEQLSQSSGTLNGAWRNRGLRLSGRSSSRWNKRATTTAAMLPPPVVDWQDLTQRWRQIHPIGLAQRKALDDVVLLQPSSWLPAVFDSVRQRLIRTLVDSKGGRLPIIVPQSAFLHTLLSNVERIQPSAELRLLGRLHLSADGPSIHPVSVIGVGGPDSLSYERTTKNAGMASPLNDDAQEIGDELDEEDRRIAAGNWPILDSAREICLALANTGIRAFRQWPRCLSLADQGQAAGMKTMAEALRNMAKENSLDRGARILTAAWIIQIQRQSMQIERAMK